VIDDDFDHALERREEEELYWALMERTGCVRAEYGFVRHYAREAQAEADRIAADLLALKRVLAIEEARQEI
jgi:hypothetical protein